MISWNLLSQCDCLWRPPCQLLYQVPAPAEDDVILCRHLEAVFILRFVSYQSDRAVFLYTRGRLEPTCVVFYEDPAAAEDCKNFLCKQLIEDKSGSFLVDVSASSFHIHIL